MRIDFICIAFYIKKTTSQCNNKVKTNNKTWLVRPVRTTAFIVVLVLFPDFFPPANSNRLHFWEKNKQNMHACVLFCCVFSRLV